MSAFPTKNGRRPSQPGRGVSIRCWPRSPATAPKNTTICRTYQRSERGSGEQQWPSEFGGCCVEQRAFAEWRRAYLQALVFWTICTILLSVGYHDDGSLKPTRFRKLRYFPATFGSTVTQSVQVGSGIVIGLRPSIWLEPRLQSSSETNRAENQSHAVPYDGPRPRTGGGKAEMAEPARPGTGRPWLHLA